MLLHEEVPLFTEEEPIQTANLLQNKKVPVPDGVPVEAVARVFPRLLLNMYNISLREGNFIRVWKKQRLVLSSN